MKARVVIGVLWIPLILGILSTVLTGCDEKDDLKPLDLSLMPGVWEVVYSGEQDVFKFGEFLEIKASSGASNGDTHGYVTTFFLTVGGTVLHDEVYSWSIRGVESHEPLLDLVLQGHADSDDLWEGTRYYKIVKLTDSHMWWKGNSVGDESVIKLRRRPDIQTE